jgi:predicted transcriptional regulator of viral defense system
MRYFELKNLKKGLFFTIKDVAGALGIKLESAKVLASRYVKKGIFIRLKNNFYVLEQDWTDQNAQFFLKIANFLQVPSYISFMTALSFYEITTQVQRDFFESVSLKRSRRFDIKGTAFSFYKLKKELYFDFVKKENIFIATKEKAFVDAVYLYSFGKYKLDFSSLDLDKLDKKRIAKIIKAFPQKTKNTVRRLCRI